jgi:putative peptidoglycan lipid II flippase
MDRARHLLKSSVIVILFLALGKLTGLFRIWLISMEFGTSVEFDAFTAANQLPEVFVTLISGGALAAAFIPVYSNYLTSKSSKESARLANTVLTLVIAVLGGISLLGIFFAPWITSNILVPDFPKDTQILTAILMRVILIQTTLFGVSGVLSSVLNAHQHFALPALAPVALDLGYIFGLVVLVPVMGINGLAWGTVLGGILHILIQVPGLRRFRFRYRPDWALNLAGTKEIIRLMGPRIVTLGAVQIADLFIIRLTSGLSAGSTSGYFYGYYIMQLPETLIGTAIAIVVFPTMAEYFNAGNIEELKKLSITALRIIWLLAVPAALALAMLGRQAITVFFQRGAFTEASTAIVYSVLIFFSVRVISEASLEILARLFYAQHNTKIPMYVAIGWLVVTVSLSFLLVGNIGIGGLALASTIAFTLQSVVLFFLNRRRLGELYGKQLLQTAGQALLGAFGMAAIIFAAGQVINDDLLLLITGGAAGLAAYIGITYLAGSRELPALVRLIRSK